MVVSNRWKEAVGTTVVGLTVTAEVAETPENEAVRVTGVEVVTCPPLTLNWADVAP